MKQKLILYLFLMLIIFAACEKEDEPCDFFQEWVQCWHGNSLEAEDTFNHLIGEWKMIDTGCQEFSSPEANIKLIFSSDSTLQVIEDGQVIRNSKFSIILTHDNVKQVETEPGTGNLYTWGDIEFCENKVGFISSYVDGLDFFFERMEKGELKE